jgi:hypothetical protein
MGFTQFVGEPCIYRKVFELNGKPEEVDDTLLGASSEEARQWFMDRFQARFPVNPKSTGVVTFDSPGLILSMRVRYDRERGLLEVDQRAAIQALAAKYGVADLKPRSMPITPAVRLLKLAKPEMDPNEYLSIVGSCLHISQVSRPDIAYAVGVLSRHSATPGKDHMEAAINLVCYLYHTQELCIRYVRSATGNVPEVFEKAHHPAKSIENRLRAGTPELSSPSPTYFADADFAGDLHTRRSTSGMIVMMNSGPISWLSRLQKLCAQSTAEAEIYAVTDSVKEAVHVRLLCEEAGMRQPGIPLTVFEDNDACLQLAHSLRGSKSARHFLVRLRFLNELIHDNVVEFQRIDTKRQLADGFTKALAGPEFFQFRNLILHPPSR